MIIRFFIFLILGLLGACSSLSSSKVEARFFSSSENFKTFQTGRLKSLNSLLPSPEMFNLKDLIRAKAAQYGFTVVESGSDTHFPVLDFDYNETSYFQDLNDVKSLTVFLTVKDPETFHTLASVFVSEDSKRTLNSWAVLFALTETAFQKLKEEQEKQTR